ncbi:MAG: glyoxylate/hydroxypyruvate reductase A [Alphaproteobacteria bacterium]|nr:glyoxylate/hydroxypyruvate reductase A [Alphaproteobacteria bacterium]MBM3949906.1 glyoxylate/hydroxypyruvate reductase A [Rhodospirillales bacterium]
MALLFVSAVEDPEPYRQEFIRLLPGEDFRIWPEAGDRAEVEFLLVWRPPRGAMKGFPNLKAILNLGAGVDYVLADPDLPREVPLVRLVDTGLRDGMVEFVLHAVLHFHRQFHRYREFQQRKSWTKVPQVEAANRRIGILGFGHLGQAAARHLLALGFPVAGWSRTRKQVPGARSFAGADELGAFLGQSDILVCLAPLTNETEGIVNARTLAQLPKGSYLINAGRGGLAVEADVLAALSTGQLAGAALDVFRREPLPPESPFWTHPNVIVTPHIAAITLVGPAAREAADNIRRLRAGLAPNGLVDKAQGY